MTGLEGLGRVSEIATSFTHPITISGIFQRLGLLGF